MVTYKVILTLFFTSRNVEKSVEKNECKDSEILNSSLENDNFQSACNLTSPGQSGNLNTFYNIRFIFDNLYKKFGVKLIFYLRKLRFTCLHLMAFKLFKQF